MCMLRVCPVFGGFYVFSDGMLGNSVTFGRGRMVAVGCLHSGPGLCNFAWGRFVVWIHYALLVPRIRNYLSSFELGFF